MKRTFWIYFNDILEAFDKIEKYTSMMDIEEFKNDLKTIDAVKQNFIVIGEAVMRIPQDIKEKYGNIPWKKITGFRNINTHEYFRLNLNLVWDVVKKSIPETKSLIIDVMWNSLIAFDPSLRSINNEKYSSLRDIYLDDIHYFTYKGLSFTISNQGNVDVENLRAVVLTKTAQHDNCCYVYRFTVPSEGSVTYKIGPTGDCAYVIIVDRDFTTIKPTDLSSIIYDISLWKKGQFYNNKKDHVS